MFQIRNPMSAVTPTMVGLRAITAFLFQLLRSQAHGFRPLRVINEDWVQPQTGFGTHGHRDMEIITYMLGSELSHRDSFGWWFSHQAQSDSAYECGHR